jgi:Pertussis toxin, subunit 1
MKVFMRPQNAPFGQKETPGREKRDNVAWKGGMLLVVVLVMTVVSSSFFLFKAHAAGGSGETSNLNNRYLGAQNDVFPGRLYRGDTQSPDAIFANGFAARGNNYDLERHVAGRLGSGYVATTGTLSQAEGSIRIQGYRSLDQIAAKAGCSATQEFFYTLIPVIGQFLLGQCSQSGANRSVVARTYVYEIDPAYAQNALYVPTALRVNAALYRRYVNEDEWAYVDRIPPEAIVGAHLYQLTANLNADGTVDENTSEFTNLNQFVSNSNYGGTTGRNSHYNPGNDTTSGWSFNTDPDLPTSSCPTDPSVYQLCS